MAIKVINTGSAGARSGSALLIYGAPKVGKTSLLGTAKEGDLLLVDVEGGRNRLTDAGLKHDCVSVKTVDDLAEVLHELRDGSLRKYGVVALDSLTELERYVTLDLMTKRKKEFAELREYGDTASKLREFFLRFRDLREDGRTVIFTAIEGEIEMTLPDGATRSLIGPLLQKKLAREVAGLVDAVGRVLISPKTNARGITFRSSSEFIAGGRYDALTTYDGELSLPKILKTIYSKHAPATAPATMKEAA